MQAHRLHLRGPGLSLALLALLAYASVCLETRSQEAPAILIQPSNTTNAFGGTSQFTIACSGTPPFGIQMFKNGTFAGFLGTSLTTNVFAILSSGANEGSYHFVVTNRFGAATTSAAWLESLDPYILTPPRSESIVGVTPPARFTRVANGTPPLRSQWLYNGSAIVGATNSEVYIQATTTNTGLYQCVVRNDYGSVTSAPALLSFNTENTDAFRADVDNTVYATAIAPGGSILLGGEFTKVDAYTRTRLCRLLPSGKVDPLFTPTANAAVYCLLPLPDGKVLVGGAFTALNGKSRGYLGRLNSDGSLDTNFNVSVNGPVHCLAITPWNGKIIAGGQNTLKQFDTNGVVSAFYPGTIFGTIYSIVAWNGAPAAVNLVYLGGDFTMSAAGMPTRYDLACLRQDGSDERLFTTTLSPSGSIYAMSLYSGGLLLGGSFTQVGAYPRTNLAKISMLDDVDSNFKADANYPVRTFSLQTGGGVIVGGEFTTCEGVPRQGLVRLDPAGKIDPLFCPSAATVQTLALQADGKLIVGGKFSSLAGVTRTSLGRLNASGDTAQELVAGSGLVKWLRGAALPSVRDVHFEMFTPGSGWISLGWGMPFSRGWQCSATPPAGATLRVRARSICGRGCGSGSLIEFSSGPLVITDPPFDQFYLNSLLTLKVAAAGEGPITYQWFRNGTLLTGETNSFYLAAPGEYRVVICNPAGCVQSEPVTVWRRNALDSSTRPNPDSTVHALTLQPDGRILVAGTFTNFASTPVNGLARMNPDGSLDETFSANFSGAVFCLAVQPDGWILAGGNFTNVNGQPRSGLARLSPAGVLDQTFVANVFGPFGPHVTCLALQDDGKILVGASSGTIAQGPRNNLARLNPNGSLDVTFLPPQNLLAGGAVRCILPLQNGLIFVGGVLESPRPLRPLENQQPYQWLGSNGDYISGPPGATSLLNQIALSAVELPDGSVIVAGYNLYYELPQPGGPPFSIIRFNSDRTANTNFAIVASGSVRVITVLADGKFLVGGSFHTLNGIACTNLVRLHPNGSVDTNFVPIVNGPVASILPEPTGKVSIGGTFTSIGTTSRSNYARFLTTGPVRDQWSYDGSTLTRAWNGPVPSIKNCVLETSPDGTQWTLLAAGTQMDDTWSFSPVSLPFAQSARVRGIVSDGVNFSQAVLPLAPPSITVEPVSRTNLYGTLAGFYVAAQGAGPFGYQWYHDDVPVSDLAGSGMVGSGDSLLTFPVSALDTGSYRVVVTNLFGTVLSQPAFLTSFDPGTPPVILDSTPAFGSSGLTSFSLRIAAAPGQSIIIERSESLKSWAPVRTNTVSSWVPVLYQDTAPQTRRFYRVRLQ